MARSRSASWTMARDRTRHHQRARPRTSEAGKSARSVRDRAACRNVSVARMSGVRSVRNAESSASSPRIVSVTPLDRPSCRRCSRAIGRVQIAIDRASAAGPDAIISSARSSDRHRDGQSSTPAWRTRGSRCRSTCKRDFRTSRACSARPARARISPVRNTRRGTRCRWQEHADPVAGREPRGEQCIAQSVGERVELAKGDDAFTLDQTGSVAEMQRRPTDQRAYLHEAFLDWRLASGQRSLRRRTITESKPPPLRVRTGLRPVPTNETGATDLPSPFFTGGAGVGSR